MAPHLTACGAEEKTIKSISKQECKVEIGCQNFCTKPLPFSIHRDLILEKMVTDGLPNKKLDTAIKLCCKQRIGDILVVKSGKIQILAHKVFTGAMFEDDFDYLVHNINLSIFELEEGSMQLISLAALKLIEFGVLDVGGILKSGNIGKTTHGLMFKDVCGCENDIHWFRCKRDFLLWQLQNEKKDEKYIYALIYSTEGVFEPNYKNVNKMFLSVGKTSEISLKSQMNWASATDIVETVVYCCIDVLLTFQLEKIYKLNLGMWGASVMKMPPFNTFGYNAGTKSEFIVNFSLFPKYAICVTRSLKPYKIFNEIMLAEECEQADISPSSNLLKMKCVESVDDIVYGARSQSECFNINEDNIGFPSEGDMSNINNFKQFNNNI